MVRLQENGEVWVSWFVGYFIRIISSVGTILNIPNAGECSWNFFIPVGSVSQDMDKNDGKVV